MPRHKVCLTPSREVAVSVYIMWAKFDFADHFTDAKWGTTAPVLRSTKTTRVRYNCKLNVVVHFLQIAPEPFI